MRLELRVYSLLPIVVEIIGIYSLSVPLNGVRVGVIFMEGSRDFIVS